MGRVLAGRPRGEDVISTKVGRLLLDKLEDVSKRDLGESRRLRYYVLRSGAPWSSVPTRSRSR
jgi:hypothetical protein